MIALKRVWKNLPAVCKTDLETSVEFSFSKRISCIKEKSCSTTTVFVEGSEEEGKEIWASCVASFAASFFCSVSATFLVNVAAWNQKSWLSTITKAVRMPKKRVQFLCVLVMRIAKVRLSGNCTSRQTSIWPVQRWGSASGPSGRALKPQ